MRKLILLVAMALIGAAVVACEPHRFDATSYETVSTFYDKKVDFESYQTFWIGKEIVEIGDDVDIDHSKDAQVIRSIRGNLQARGYTEVQDSTQADLLVMAGVTTRDWTSTSCYPSWGGGYCWYYPCYGWCYPVSTSFTEGILLMAMVDRETSEANEEFAVNWFAGLAGYIKGLSNIKTVLAGVDQAFVQSPYIRAAVPSPAGKHAGTR